MLAGLVSFSPTGFTHSGSGPAANQTSESLCWMDGLRALSTPFNFLFFAVFAAVAGNFIGAKAGESGDGPILERRTGGAHGDENLEQHLIKKTCCRLVEDYGFQTAASNHLPLHRIKKLRPSPMVLDLGERSLRSSGDRLYCAEFTRTSEISIFP
ncbi:hypothetical protein B0O80DRAFT_431859 [Mortierella sp. GBAus27b]|nr:hypothetical protein B0O80DRAFT_431859 [Mortierella sp. GBAus27b]